jgi:hypothetical protein
MWVVEMEHASAGKSYHSKGPRPQALVGLLGRRRLRRAGQGELEVVEVDKEAEEVQGAVDRDGQRPKVRVSGERRSFSVPDLLFLYPVIFWIMCTGTKM